MHTCTYAQIAVLLSVKAIYWKIEKSITDRLSHQSWRASFTEAGLGTNYHISWNTNKLFGLFQALF